MIRAVATRISEAALTFLAASFLLFAVTKFSPGSVAARILGPYALESQVALLSDRLGLEDPLPVRYARWLGTLAGVVPERLGDPTLGLGLSDPRGDRYLGNLGFSLMQREPVIEVVGERIGHTARLAAWSVGIAVPLALTLGAVAGARPGSAVDLDRHRGAHLAAGVRRRGAVARALLGLARLAAWDGDARPGRPLAGGRADGAAGGRARDRVGGLPHPHHPRLGGRRDGARLRAHGAAQGPVALAGPVGHALRPALIAPVTAALLQVNWILTGVVVVEAIFAYPGLGSLMLRAALFGDIHVVQALTLLALAVALGTQLLGDLAYMALDPRIRPGAAA